MSLYYSVVEEFLAKHEEIQFKPKLIAFDGIEEGGREALARNLCLYRKSVNLPQAKMARIFGISLSQYKKYEMGLEILRVDLAQKWSLRFSTPFFHLLRGCGYGEGLTTSDFDDRFNFLWFLANSLTDEYFSRLIDLLCLFTGKSSTAKSLAHFGITRLDLKKVLQEIDSEMYIAIAYGLQAIRKRFQFSQEHIAELLGVSVSTYQQYEKPTMKPRFSIFIAARYGMATGINPLVIVAGTLYAKVRYMQNERMALIRDIVANVDQDRLLQLKPLLTGFSNMARQIPGALIVDI